MSIIIDEKKKTFYLNTVNSTYSFIVHQSGALVHLYYGKKIKGDLSHLFTKDVYSFAPTKREYGNDFSLNSVPLEYSGYNTGDFRINSISVKNSFGALSCDLAYCGYRIQKGFVPDDNLVFAERSDSETLIVECFDKCLNCSVNLYYTVYEDYDVITRSCSLINHGETVYVNNFASGVVDFYNNDLEFTYLAGGYYYENTLRKSAINQGVFEISSNNGSTGHSQNPAIMFYDTKTNEDSGNVFAFNLIYSGNFSNRIQKNNLGFVRFVSGINQEGFSYRVDADESLHTPEMIMCYSEGFAQATNKMHRFIKNKISPKKDKLPSILFNTWEANYFNISHDILVEYSDYAKQLGLNLVVMDDGWFSTRNNDTKGLGTWVVNRDKFPNGLEKTAEEITAKGMEFGIWIEPEMVNPDEEVLKQHPDWYIQIQGRESSISRNQLVLDFTNDAVINYVYSAIKKVVEKVNISYVKWDMNRYLTEVGSLNLSTDRQGEIFHRYVLGVYTLYKKIIALLPNVHFEGCSGGGGRFDLGMLRLNSTVWASDNTDAYERIKTQFYNAIFYPPSVMSVHIGRDEQGFTKRRASLKFRYAVALSGILGVEFNVKKLSKEEIEELKTHIEDYKKQEDLIVNGDYFRLSDVADIQRKCAFEYVSSDKNKALAVYLQILGETNKGRIYLKFKGLDSDKLYQLSGDLDGRFYGSDLMNAGVVLPKLYGDGQAVIINAENIKEENNV